MSEQALLRRAHHGSGEAKVLANDAARIRRTGGPVEISPGIRMIISSYRV